MIIEQPDDEKKNYSTQPSVGSGGGAGAVGGLSVPEQGNTSTTTPDQTNAVQKEATIQDYLGANKSQANDLGNKFQSNLQGALSKDTGDIASAADATKNAVNSNVVNYDSNLVNTALTDPTKITGDPNQLQSFLKQWNASYAGPKTFETSDQYGTAAKAASDASTKAALVGDTGGRQQLLQDDFKVYGQGNKGLDNNLLQTSENFGDIQQMIPQFTNVGTYLNNQAKDVNDAATKAQTTTDATKASTQGAFANKLTDFQGGLNKRVSDLQSSQSTLSDQVKADLASGDATKITADLGKFNLTDAQRLTIKDYLAALNKDYGVTPDLSSAYSYNPAASIDTSNVATKQDYDNAAALQQLTGVDYGGVLNQANASKAGTAGQDLSTSLNGQDLDTGLRNALWESAVNGLNPKTASNAGNSSQPKSGKSLSDYLKVGGAVANPITAGSSLLVNPIGKELNKVGDSISNAIGIGGGKGDAQVNLAPFNAAGVPVPSVASPTTMKEIASIINKPISTAGSYHENGVDDAAGRIAALKSYLSLGQITDKEYEAYSKPILEWAKNAIATISGASSEAANSVKGPANNLNTIINGEKHRYTTNV